MRFLAASTIVLASLWGAPAIAQAGSADVVGTWLTEDGRAKIRTEHCGEAGQHLCGFVVWLKQPLTDEGQPRTDIKNPDPAKRSRPSLGLELMVNLKPEDTTHFAGEIYNADDGKMYNVTLIAEKPDTLEIHGCLLKFLCGSQSWTRVADLPVPGLKVVQTTTVPAATGKPKAANAGKAHDTQSTK